MGKVSLARSALTVLLWSWPSNLQTPQNWTSSPRCLPRNPGCDDERTQKWRTGGLSLGKISEGWLACRMIRAVHVREGIQPRNPCRSSPWDGGRGEVQSVWSFCTDKIHWAIVMLWQNQCCWKGTPCENWTWKYNQDWYIFTSVICSNAFPCENGVYFWPLYPFEPHLMLNYVTFGSQQVPRTLFGHKTPSKLLWLLSPQFTLNFIFDSQKTIWLCGLWLIPILLMHT